MAETVDFEGVMAELTVFQNAVGKIHANLQNAKNKEILGDVLEKIRDARADVEIEYPKAMNLIQETANRVLAESQQGLAQLDQRKADVEKKAAAYHAALDKAALPPSQLETKVDPTLGLTLRTELLDRFGPQDDSDDHGADKIREAWQDWN